MAGGTSTYEIKVTGEKHLAIVLTQIAHRIGHPREPLEEMALAVSEANLKAFETEGASTGKPWPPLSPKYAAWKIGHGFPPHMLIRTGRLFKELVELPLNIQQIHGNSARFGTKTPYYHWLHFGTSKMPARPVLVVTPALAHRLSWIAGHYIIPPEDAE